MRRSFGPMLWLLPMLLPLAGCEPEIPADDLGTVQFELPTLPDADKPFEMPELGPKRPPGSAAPSENKGPSAVEGKTP